MENLMCATMPNLHGNEVSKCLAIISRTVGIAHHREGSRPTSRIVVP